MARRRRLFEMTPDESIDGIRMSTVALSDEEILRRVRETVEGRLRSSGLSLFPMCPTRGYISLVSPALPLPPRLPCSLHFPVPLFVFAVPAGDEGRASLPIAHSRGHRAAGGEPGTCRGAKEAEGRRGGKAQARGRTLSAKSWRNVAGIRGTRVSWWSRLCHRHCRIPRAGTMRARRGGVS